MRNAAIVITAVVTLLVPLGVPSQNSIFTDFDPIAAEKNIRAAGRTFMKNLHEFERYPDGTKGFGVPDPEGLRAVRPNPPPPPFATDLEWETYYAYCGSDAIVLATNLDSKSTLTDDKRLIYTMSHFSVVDVVKSEDGVSSGQRLVVYRLGGTVEDAGEKLRIATPDTAPFEPQKKYILRLRRDRLAAVAQYYLPEGLTIAVTDAVYPIRGKYAWFTGSEAFPSGTPYSEIKARFAKVHALKPCP